MFFKPEQLALAGLLVYLALWIVAPLEAESPLSITALLYITLCFGAFFSGCIAGNRNQILIQPPVNQLQPARKAAGMHWFWFWLSLGVVGIMFRLFDKFVLRNAILFGSAIENREALADTTAGVLSTIGGVLYPFCYLPLFMLWIQERKFTKSAAHLKWIAILVAMLPTIEALLLLSRSQMLLAFGMLYFSISCTLYDGRALPKKLIFPILLSLGILVGVSGLTFLIRLDDMERQLLDSLQTSAYAELLGPSDLAMRILTGENSVFSIAFANAIPFFQYYLHGLYEFSLLWERPDVQIFSYGAEHLFPYVKFASIIGIFDKSLITQDLYFREGVFTTFFGSLWVDFGWFGLFVIFGLGFISKRIAVAAKSISSSFLPIYSFICVVIFFMPVVNLIVSAQGMYVANAFIIFHLIMKKSAFMA